VRVQLRRSPLGQAKRGAGAHDCGPERSLRTSPSSSSSRPTAFPTDSLGRIKVARPPLRLPEGLRASWLVALLDLWSGNRTSGTPIVAARAAAIGVCAFAFDAGALRAGDERFSNGAARRGGAVVVGAAESVLRVTSHSRRPQTVGVPTRFQSQAVPLSPHARASSLRRKTPRKPQKAARAAGLRRAP